MVRTMLSAAVAATLVLGPAAPALARTPVPGPSAGPVTAQPLPGGWSRDGDVLTWRSPVPVRAGDAFVEFYAGKHPLGLPARAPDGRTFRLDLDGPGSLHSRTDLKDLQVRAAGRRLDVPEGTTTPRRATPSAPRRPAPSSPPSPAAEVDPGTAGRYGTVEGEYALDDVTLPELDAPVEMKAVVVAPKGAPGRRPLVLLLHGMFASCFEAGGSGLTYEWPCKEGTAPTPSYRGYLRTQRLLASQGYVTVSISANGVNSGVTAPDGGAQARSSLVRLHLERWARWAAEERATAPAVVREAPPADLAHTLLIGHSRGGEGVNRAAMDSLVPPPAAVEGYHGTVRWTIRGMLLIAPIAPGQNPTPNVPSIVVLPGCDGDVYDLQGQMYVDAARGIERGNALHAAVYVEGANHNFFNTEWTPGLAQASAVDDAKRLCDPASPTRLTADQQQAVGATYAATAARLFLAGDDRARPLVDGTGAVPASVAPALVHTHAVGGTRKVVVLPSATTKVTGDGARLCLEVAQDDENPCVSSTRADNPSPHFARFLTGWGRSEEGRYAVDAAWSAPGTPVSVSAADGARVAPGDQLALRVIVPPGTTGTSFTVAVRTSTGKRSTARAVTLDGLPGTGRDATFWGQAAYWGQEVRVPLTGVSGVVDAVELTPTSVSGELWLVDAWTWRPGTPAPLPVEVPARIDLGTVKVAEGDSGTRTVDFPISVTGTGSGTVRFLLVDDEENEVAVRDVEIRAGRPVTGLSVPVAGNPWYGPDRLQELDVRALAGSMVGAYSGGVLVTNDDPLPTVTAEPVTTAVTEGGTLTWRVRLSEPTEDPVIRLTLRARAPADGPELSTTDLDPAWADSYLAVDREPARPLSAAPLGIYLTIDGGRSTQDITVVTVADDVPEPVRSVEFEVRIYRERWEEAGRLRGTVRDA